VLCDYKGVKNAGGTYLQNPLDIIVDILSVFAGITYNSTNYNTAEWDVVKAHALANNIGIFIYDETEIRNVIEEISTSTFGNFIIQDDWKYTFRIYDSLREIERTIYLEEMIEAPQIEWRGDEFLTSCKIGYKRDWALNSHRWHVENADEAELYSKYKKYISRNFDTLLTNSTDAAEYALAVMDYYKDVKAIYSVKTKTQNLSLDVTDFANIEINRVSKTWLDFVKTEVLRISKDLLNNVIQITARHVLGFTGFFFGALLLPLLLKNMQSILANTL